MSPEPAKKPDHKEELKRLQNPEDLARSRFGNADGLAIVNETTLGLAKHYATRFELDVEDPEVSLITTALAFTRHKEFMLFMEVERDLQSRVMNNPGRISYGEVLLNTARTGAYRDVNRELDRLHNRASVYLKELRTLSKEE